MIREHGYMHESFYIFFSFFFCFRCALLLIPTPTDIITTTVKNSCGKRCLRTCARIHRKMKSHTRMAENGCRTVCRNSLTAIHPPHTRSTSARTHTHSRAFRMKGVFKRKKKNRKKNPHIPTHTRKQLIYLSTTFL